MNYNFVHIFLYCMAWIFDVERYGSLLQQHVDDGVAHPLILAECCHVRIVHGKSSVMRHSVKSHRYMSMAWAW
jgi:hypothetical protein